MRTSARVCAKSASSESASASSCADADEEAETGAVVVGDIRLGDRRAEELAGYGGGGGNAEACAFLLPLPFMLTSPSGTGRSASALPGSRPSWMLRKRSSIFATPHNPRVQ